MIHVLKVVHFITEEGDGAFRARIRKLQGEGVPFGSNPGKGKSVAYTLPMIIELAFALELIQCGLSPAEAAGTIVPIREDLYIASLVCWNNQGDTDANLVLLFSPEALKQYSSTASHKTHSEVMAAVSIVSRKALLSIVSSDFDLEESPITGRVWRWSMIDIKSVVEHLVLYIEDETLSDMDPRSIMESDFLARQTEIRTFNQNRRNVIATWLGTAGGASTIRLAHD